MKESGLQLSGMLLLTSIPFGNLHTTELIHPRRAKLSSISIPILQL